ncbi:MAG TPA: M1 family metallopeptidase [Steroidobacteraceae bacterium]|nr:M1 family metallopeptidase [Steroidobacteraceae bacterium]
MKRHSRVFPAWFIPVIVLAVLSGCGSKDKDGGAAPSAAASVSLPAAASPGGPGATATRTVAPVLSGPEAKDIHSYAEPDIARVSNVDLDLTAHFDSRTLQGTATLDVLSGVREPTLTLDTRDLNITAVTDDKGQALPWHLATPDPVMGSALRIQLGAARRVRITYSSSPGAQALQWLTPAQTAGGKQPYLFSQGEADLNRSWLPTQDSPGIRQTWAATIRAPEALTVVMSAGRLDEPKKLKDGLREWRYGMEHPVAPYLIAIAIGDLAFQSLGERTGVYTEPSGLKVAADELADIEKMVAAAESIYGPYRWGRYDVLVMPPSFPFGGMENPRLTFATPTIIAGDRSLVSLVAHELAHSWSGNLVTNATWADFWLNEGFTVYFENRIMERVYGADAAAMQADLGWDSLQQEIRELGGPRAPDTRLHLDLTGRNPDDGMTSIPYEKGATFLRTIEAAVGRERWDAWLRDYFDRHAFQPQTSTGFLDDLREHLIKDDAALEKRLKLDTWVFEPGLPANAVHVKSAAFAKIDARAAAFSRSGIAAADVQSWSSPERVRFLNRLPRKLGPAQLKTLAAAMDLDAQRNSEVRFAWLELAIANRYEPAVPNLEDFLMKMGRRKFVLPLFKDLVAQGEWGRALARRIYPAARPGYHSVTTSRVDPVVPLAAAKSQ